MAKLWHQRKRGLAPVPDEARWDLLCRSVVAGHRRDGPVLREHVLSLVSHGQVEEGPRCWLEWLAHYRVEQLLGRPASRGDLSQIAGYLEDLFREVCSGVGLFEVLQIMWKTEPAPRERPAGIINLLVGEAAALGVLLKDPQAELDAARPALEAWCRSRAI